MQSGFGAECGKRPTEAGFSRSEQRELVGVHNELRWCCNIVSLVILVYSRYVRTCFMGNTVRCFHPLAATSERQEALVIYSMVNGRRKNAVCTVSCVKYWPNNRVNLLNMQFYNKLMRIVTEIFFNHLRYI